MPEYITNDIEISSNDSDEGNSNEENSNEEILMKKILIERILMSCSIGFQFL